MISTGSKYFYGLAGLGLVAALVYGTITNGVYAGGVMTLLSSDGAVDAVLGPLTLGYKGGVGDHLGYTLLLGFATVALCLGMMTSKFRDGDVEMVAMLTGSDDVPPIASVATHTFWPIITAFSLGLVMVGLATSSIMFIAGLIALGISGLEWTLDLWADQISGDAEFNRDTRNRLMRPIEIPAAAVIGAGIIVFCISRILLAVSADGAAIVGIVLAGAIFGGAVLVAKRERISRSTIVAVLLITALVILAVGIGGAIAGQRDIEEHHVDHAHGVVASTSAPGAAE